eukprot:GHVO01016308.1.p1 GENE.GHVO01016308.1~~GHVO01016308.1.p1  ORF type:complete len:611 (+),score=84.67 GHVO01016308.1:142-1974(+)
MIALMGASGAGKSTLLNVLSGRNSNRTGELLYNNTPLTQEEAKRRTAYIQQEDLFFGKLTVKEHLDVQARLRLPKHLNAEKRNAIVTNVMGSLGLAKCEGSRIGNTMMGEGRGISGGEKKRLNIASELLTSPTVLFADEPTTGLDSFVATSVCESLRALADTGRTIICTIHQPSARIFNLFDELILMADGRILYFGPIEASIEWFARMGHKCPALSNPADFLIRVISSSDENRAEKTEEFLRMADKWIAEGEEFKTQWDATLKGEFDTRRQSVLIKQVSMALSQKANAPAVEDLVRRASQSVKSLSIPHIELPIVTKETEVIDIPEGKSINWFQQLWILFRRAAMCTARDPLLMYARAIQTVIMGLVMGGLYFRLDWDLPGARSRFAGCFGLLTQQVMLGAMAVTHTFPDDKVIVQREYESGISNMTAFFVAKTMADMPVQIVFPFIFHTITWYMMAMNDDPVQWIIGAGVMLLCANAGMSIGYFSSAIAPTAESALLITQVTMIPLLLFGGFMVDLEEVSKFWIWVEYMSPFKYGLSGYSITSFKGEQIAVEIAGGTRYVDSMEFLNQFGIRAHHFGRDLAALAGLIVGIRVCAALLMQLTASLKKQKS